MFSLKFQQDVIEGKVKNKISHWYNGQITNNY